MPNLFTRYLTPGLAPGIQLNPLVDNSEISVDRRDQYFGGILKLPRGRIDKPFLVTPGNVFNKIGNGAWLGKTTNAYKSHVAVFEALKNGAAGAVLQRLVGADAVNRYIVVKSDTATNISIPLTPTLSNGVIKAVGVTNQGSNYYHPTAQIVSATNEVISDIAAGIALDINCGTGEVVHVTLWGGTPGLYANNDAFNLTNTIGGGFVGHLANVPADGSLHGATVVIEQGGSNYSHLDISSSGPGTGAVFIVRMPITGSNAGKILAISVANGGSGYHLYNAAIPSLLTITDPVGYYGTGTGATAIINNIENGVITAIATPSPTGTSLTDTPIVTIKNINGGIGNRAAATATVTAGDISAVTVTNGGSGYTTDTVQITANLTVTPQFYLSATLPDPALEPYLFAIKDLECFNNGVIIGLHCEDKSDANGNFIDTARITVRIIDPARPRTYRYEFIGNLSDGGFDDFGGSTYLPDTVARKTDNIVIAIGSDTVISPDNPMYGLDDDDNEKWVYSNIMHAFTEGDAAYTNLTYRNARNKLAATPLDFQYLSSLDTDSVALLGELAQVSFLTNRNLRFDVQGDTVGEAVEFMNQLNFTQRAENHLLHAFWCPLTVEDPTHNNGSLQMGAATLNIAFACARNARKDSRGFAPKHYPIMGKDWALGKARTNIRAPFTLGRGQLNALAKAKINAVIYEDGNYIFSNAITCADVDISLRKLIAVTDMSTSIDDAVVRFCSSVKGYPINDAIKLTKDYLKALFEGAEAAGWIVPSDDPVMLGRPYKYDVLVSPDRPYDAFTVDYWVRYQGTALYIYITQTYTR
ncbi:MAG: hypothetical protein PHU14_05375 [Methylovulum sp.]|nr:hypothetical protein [Methylovulum sp.]